MSFRGKFLSDNPVLSGSPLMPVRTCSTSQIDKYFGGFTLHTSPINVHTLGCWTISILSVKSWYVGIFDLRELTVE